MVEGLGCYRTSPTQPINQSCTSNLNSRVSISLAARPYAKLIEHAACEAALDPALVHAVISVESAYNATARSPAGAIGLMQLMPDTALRYGVKDPARSLEGNLRAGTQYLRDLMRMFNGRLDLVLAAYNAGENAVIKYGQKIPPYAETQAYVPAVLAKYREWRVALPAARRCWRWYFWRASACWAFCSCNCALRFSMA